VILSDEAEEEILLIFDYNLNATKDFDVTMKIDKNIRKSISELYFMPERGSNLQNKVPFKTDLKYIRVYSWDIIYRIVGDEVHVKAIVHERREDSFFYTR